MVYPKPALYFHCASPISNLTWLAWLVLPNLIIPVARRHNDKLHPNCPSAYCSCIYSSQGAYFCKLLLVSKSIAFKCDETNLLLHTFPIVQICHYKDRCVKIYLFGALCKYVFSRPTAMLVVTMDSGQTNQT